MQRVSTKALHLGKTLTGDPIHVAAQKPAIPGRVKHDTLRHSFATHVLEDRYDIRTLQGLSGREGSKTTTAHSHVRNRGGGGARRPDNALRLVLPRALYRTLNNTVVGPKRRDTRDWQAASNFLNFDPSEHRGIRVYLPPSANPSRRLLRSALRATTARLRRSLT